MKLRIADPISIAVDRDVLAVRAEDASGSFGILAGHANLVTALEISIVSWREMDGRQAFCAVRNGVLTVSNGRHIDIATREAHVGDTLEELETVVLTRYRAHREAERGSRTASARMRMLAIRRMVEALQGGAIDPGAGISL